MSKLRVRTQSFLERDQAVTAVEYAVLAALILMAVVSAVTAVGNSTSGLWSKDADKITDAINPK